VCTIEGFQQGGCTCGVNSVRFVQGEGDLGVWLLSYLGRGHIAFLGLSGRCFGGVLIYYESGTISHRGRAQPLEGSTHGKSPSFIIQQGNFSILFLAFISTLPKCFGGYWGQGRRGHKSSCSYSHKLVRKSPSLRVWSISGKDLSCHSSLAGMWPLEACIISYWLIVIVL
jgi:hypothetical protein